jgi:hypothetical protein
MAFTFRPYPPRQATSSGLRQPASFPDVRERDTREEQQRQGELQIEVERPDEYRQLQHDVQGRAPGHERAQSDQNIDDTDSPYLQWRTIDSGSEGRP